MSSMAPERTGRRGNVFTNKIGPLPMWAWLAIVLTAVLAWAWYRNRNTSSTASTNANASQVPQFVNQTFTNVGPPTAPTPGSAQKCPGDQYWDPDADGGKGKCVPEPGGKKPPGPPKKKRPKKGDKGGDA